MRTRELKAGLVLVLSAASSTAAQDPYPITGVSAKHLNNDVPLRRNIRDLAAEAGPQWDLYIQALLEMQKADYTDTLSYFQIEGIHGRPFIEWNATGRRTTDGWAGYCPHGELLFLSWHRPYVVLFEQVLVLQARKIASTYPPRVRDDYMQAADELRAPFWDWAADATVPSVTVPAKITVNIPNGQEVRQSEIDNPLFTFNIPQSVVDGQYGSFDSDNRNRTLRCPAPQSYPSSANDLLSQRPYKDWVYDAFARADNFSEFTSTSARFVSMELIHNGIHWDAACGQQFLGPDLSGFDPLFMLHHSNMDRLWAYWQVIRPDEDIFQGSYSGLSRFGSPEGATITSQSHLQPFFGLNGKPHTTQTVRTLKGFGYSYEGLEYWHKSEDQMRRDAITLINRLYSEGGESRGERRQVPQTKRRYFARISVDRADIPKPCQIMLSINEKAAGSFVVLGQPARGILSAGMPLDKALRENNITTRPDDDVPDAIAASMKVQIVQPDGSIVNNVPSLKVALEDVEVTPPLTPDSFPTFGLSNFFPVANLLRELAHHHL
ncbi:Tyrosinase [Purpureocillium takamizusanense]|nr:Tyrosinase [Purpureocillium takamizusanense]UNI17886.1 Tyrosinase [Purpureocillium takamizusanense]